MQHQKASKKEWSLGHDIHYIFMISQRLDIDANALQDIKPTVEFFFLKEQMINPVY